MPAAAQECPKGAEKVGEDAKQIRCKCLPGRVLVSGQCVLADEAEEAQAIGRLAKRMKGAVRGLEASVSALAREAKAAGQGELSDRIREEILPRIAAVLSLDDKGLALVGYDALATVRNFLDELSDCAFEGAKVKASCKSAGKFLEMAQKTNARIAALSE